MPESDTRLKVYQTLVSSSGEYLSGEHLSMSLGLSRTAIWKAIVALRQRGFIIQSSPGHGYRLVGSSVDLSQESIEANLLSSGTSSSRLPLSAVHYFPSTTSTNDVAKEMAREGCPHGTLVVADTQSAGRGRLARSWSSPAGKGLWFSLVLRPDSLPLMEATRLTGTTAVAVVDALKKSTGLSIGIKWPNDIFVSGRKLAGILVEISAEVDAVSWAVIGVGININTLVEDFPQDIQPVATSLLMELGKDHDRLPILCAVAESIMKCTDSLVNGGWENILGNLRNLSCVIGHEVVVSFPDGNRMRGKALDINDDSTLLVQDNEGACFSVNVGDVSLRLDE